MAKPKFYRMRKIRLLADGPKAEVSQTATGSFTDTEKPRITLKPQDTIKIEGLAGTQKEPVALLRNGKIDYIIHSLDQAKGEKLQIHGVKPRIGEAAVVFELGDVPEPIIDIGVPE